MYAQAQVEIDKLSSLHAQSAVDWPRLAMLCETILGEHGKDFTVAVWLVCAWTRQHGSTGLGNGMRVLKDLVTLYWDALTPPPNRLRARRNQAQWLIEWLDKALEEPFAAVDRQCISRLVEDWEAIDCFWREKDPEAPGFFRLGARLAALPCLSDAPTPAVAQSVPPQATAPIGTQVAAPIAASGLSALPSAQVTTAAAPSSLDEIDSGVERIMEAFAPLHAYCLEQHPTLPLAYRLARVAAWTTLEHLPANDGRATRLPSPPEPQRNTLQRLLQTAEPIDVVRFCEGRLSSFPLWLDLNRASHAALLSLGAAAAANAVAQETRGLIQRLPGLAALTYADGIAFAEPATQAWLDALRPSATTHDATDPLQALLAQAQTLALEENLEAALAHLQEAIEGNSAERQRFVLRTAQCDLVQRFAAQTPTSLPVQTLLDEAEERRLDSWEPALVKPLLNMMLAQSEHPEYARRLARIDLSSYWRQVRPRTGE